AEIRRITDGVYRARDLINRPANDLGPAELAGAVESLASAHGADFHTISGADLATDYPLIHAVGAASDRAPLLAEMTWGDPAHPKVTLVGKGVVFDTGGLDLKPAAGMALMKKDMGGAAATIGLASMIMDAALPVRLRVLIPAVENSVSGRAFRPGDIFKSRKGLTVEIGNTDAEGRLVLADALARADEEAPDLLVSMATLTGAARVAVGPDLVPLFSHYDGLVAGILASAEAQYDPVWRLPLWRPYDKWLDSKVADLNHIGGKAFAGASIAALFLNRFVDAGTTYAHFDIYGWAPDARPWAPAGGDAQAIRALFDYLSRRYCKV
ncbi:MAG: leucyl aminopeptidase family protein, partial [Alphaproteobacteria bacterium]